MELEAAYAVVLDQAMPQSALNKIYATLPSITGSFSQYDEVAFYTYDANVHPVADFRAATAQLDLFRPE